MDNERRYFPSRAMIAEPSSPLGDIKINFEVIANIVRLSVVDIPGVVAVGGNWLRKIETLIPNRHAIIDGVYIIEDGDSYAIKVRVQMVFGVELSKIAYEIQNKVRDNLQTMANVSVTRVDVIIDGIHKIPDTVPLPETAEPKTATKERA